MRNKNIKVENCSFVLNPEGDSGVVAVDGKVLRTLVNSARNKLGYGKRAIAESFFSAFKRIFGETLMARKREKIIKEIQRRFSSYIINLKRIYSTKAFC